MTVLLGSILVVDDDENIRKLLSSILSNEGYTVETAKNGKEAIKSCEKFDFDAALIDVELPGMKGTELLKRLKKLRPKMINIIITGHPSLDSAMKAVNERADGYILKPLKVWEILKLIERLLTEKTNENVRLFGEFARNRENSPTMRYQTPDSWSKK